MAAEIKNDLKLHLESKLKQEAKAKGLTLGSVENSSAVGKFINTSTINDYILRVIYPLNLTDSMKVFKNVYENNDYNIKNKTTGGNEKQIDILDLYDIPSYVCCTPNKGKLKRINLETINYYLNNTKKFYQYKPSKKSVWIYNKPIKFNSLVGKRILDNLLK